MIDNELLTADKNGITVGKNLEVVGKIKLDNGFSPIYSYNDNAGNTFNIYSEIDNGDGCTFFGDLNSTDIGIGYYTLDDFDNIETIKFLKMDTDGLSVYVGQDNYEKFVTVYKLTDELNKKQNELYRHILTMVANTEEGDSETSIIEYISTNNLKVDSLEKLTTLLKPTADFIYPLGPVVNADLGGVTDYNYLKYSNSVWKFAGSASNTTDVDVSSVSDVVAAL